MSVCVWQGGGAAPELQQIRHTCAQFMPITLSLKAWSSHHVEAGLLRLHALVMCYPTWLILPFRPASTPPAHPAVPPGIYPSCSSCRSARHLPLLLILPFRPASTPPAHPAVPPGIYPSCSSCRSARHLPLLLILPFRPASTPPAHPAVPPGIYPSCSSCCSARYLPLLLTLPFRPVSTSPAPPAVPAGTYLSRIPVETGSVQSPLSP